MNPFFIKQTRSRDVAEVLKAMNSVELFTL